MTDPVRQIADTVLYEGYLLWPYRRSALKNRERWTFGCVFPPGWTAAHADDRSEVFTECLIEHGGGAWVDARARFLHLVRRQACDRHGLPVDEVTAGGARILSWEEATERELEPGAFRIPAGSHCERLESGAIVRSWDGIEGRFETSLEPVSSGLMRVTARVANTTPWNGSARGEALRCSLCSAHIVLQVSGGAFVSPLDDRAAECRNGGLWPALAGEPPERSIIVAAPIILGDYPRVAPESHGDLFDGGEIDQLLTLSILGLTDAEREEMCASDPRAREILERTDALRGEDLLRLHGTIRELRHLDGENR